MILVSTTNKRLPLLLSYRLQDRGWARTKAFIVQPVQDRGWARTNAFRGLLLGTGALRVSLALPAFASLSDHRIVSSTLGFFFLFCAVPLVYHKGPRH